MTHDTNRPRTYEIRVAGAIGEELGQAFSGRCEEGGTPEGSASATCCASR